MVIFVKMIFKLYGRNERQRNAIRSRLGRTFSAPIRGFDFGLAKEERYKSR